MVRFPSLRNNSKNQTWAKNYDNQNLSWIVNPSPRSSWYKVLYNLSIQIVEWPSLLYTSSQYVQKQWLRALLPWILVEKIEGLLHVSTSLLKIFRKAFNGCSPCFQHYPAIDLSPLFTVLDSMPPLFAYSKGLQNSSCVIQSPLSNDSIAWPWVPFPFKTRGENLMVETLL